MLMMLLVTDKQVMRNRTMVFVGDPSGAALAADLAWAVHLHGGGAPLRTVNKASGGGSHGRHGTYPSINSHTTMTPPALP